MNHEAASWSELPSKLLLQIADILGSQLYIQPLRLVCKTWCKSITLPYLTSKNILSPLFPHRLSKHICYYDYGPHPLPYLVACSVFLFQSTLEPDLPPWLFTAEELNRGKLFVTKSLSPFDFSDNLPTDFPTTLDVSHIRVSQLAAFHRSRYPADLGVRDHTFIKLNKTSDNVVVFVRPGKSTFPAIADCTTVVLHYDGTITATRLDDETVSKRLECSIRKKCGKSDKSVKYEKITVNMFDDIVVFEEKLYALDKKCRLYATDYDTLSMTNYIEESLFANNSDKHVQRRRLANNSDKNSQRRRLAVSNDGQELYLIHRYKSSSQEMFNVYKLNEEQKKWDRVNGIGDDRVLFVTLDGCFFVSVNNVPGWIGNCIVLCTRETFLIYYLNTTISSNLLWPPPKWIASHSCVSKWKKKVDVKNQAGAKIDSSTVKFKGLDISSNFVETLQKLWYKHGSLIKNSTKRTGDTVARALESLATMVNILENTSARSLSDSQIDYLNSNLTVLQRMRIKVDWLVPFVEKATQLHKNKPRIELMHRQAEIAERRSKLNEELAKLDELEYRVTEDLANVENFTPFSENVDLDQPVGWGLS